MKQAVGIGRLGMGVVGGGDTAADEALTLTKYVDRVLMFHRRDRLRVVGG